MIESSNWRARAGAMVLLVAGLCCFAAPKPACGQAPVGREVPSTAYYAAKSSYYEGDYNSALKTFLSEGRGGIKMGTSRWIDSICYHAMSGECYYQMGELAKALEHFSSALQIYVAYCDWMLRVQFPPALRPAGPAMVKRVPWGASTRQAPMGEFPRSMLIGQGQLDNASVVKRGGVIQMPSLHPICVQEIVRCTVLSLRRRAMLLGPAGEFDPLTTEVLAALMRRPGPPNHWSEAWIDLPLAISYLSAGKTAQAVQPLERSVLAGGQFDHPLTSSALLTLGFAALNAGNYPMAAKFFSEASFTAVNFEDWDVLEEAFRYGMTCHLLSNQKGIYPPLLPAMAWAKRGNLRQLHASLSLLAAENYVALGEAREAAKMLDEARQAIGRRDMGNGRMGARFNYVSAAVMYQQRRLSDGDASLVNAMKFMRGGSFWLYHIGLIDERYVRGAFTARQAMELYRRVLRDPLAADWVVEPMESMAVVVTPHPGPFERWFEVAMERKEYESALEIGDRIRRHRFFMALAPDEMGGRILSLRWLLNASEASLSQESKLHRQDMLLRFPSYADLAKQTRGARTQLLAQPPVPASPEKARDQLKLLTDLGALAAKQEAVLREIAVRREPADFIFPPMADAQAIQKAIAPGHALLAFLCTSQHTYGFLFNKERYTYWRLEDPAGLYRKMRDLLREMGNYDVAKTLTVKELSDPKWKTMAADVLLHLLKGSQADFAQPFEELVIVPDGFLWYLPFEALQVPVNKQLRPLLSRFRIRYVPTASLSVSDARPRVPGGNTGIVLGQMPNRDSDPFCRATAERLVKTMPGGAILPTPLPIASSIYGTLFDRLIVFDNIAAAESTPLGWNLMPHDRNKGGGSLADWMALPWDGPDAIVLPGFATAAENGLKRVSPATAGQEIFLSACGLMATGARTVLLSRWRTGGQTSCDLVREFSQELPHSPAADAWQRSVQLSVENSIDLAAEPRVKASSNEEAPKPAHPFFWASYMLFDSAGSGPPLAEGAAGPALKPLSPEGTLKPLPPEKEKPAPKPE